MRNFPYDTRFVYSDEDEAQDALEAQEARINLVLPWLVRHGAPSRHSVIIVCSGFPTPDGGVLHWCQLSLDFEGIDDDKKPVMLRTSLYHVLSRPDVCLMDLSRALGAAAATQDDRWRREPSKQINFEYWLEPPPEGPPPPVPRPFGPHPDQFDDACMLSNSSDKFQTGAEWTEPDETLWQKERGRRGYASYFRWRQISQVRPGPGRRPA